jgi:hypothetical protein
VYEADCVLWTDCLPCVQYYRSSAKTQWALPIRSVMLGMFVLIRTASTVFGCRWMAPESYFDGTWNLRTDVWMFGVLIWGGLVFAGSVARFVFMEVVVVAEIYSMGATPWAEVTTASVMQTIQQRGKLAQPTQCPSGVFEVLLSCWRLDPQARPSASGIQTQILSALEATASPSENEVVWPAVVQSSDWTSAGASSEDPMLDMQSEASRQRFKALEVPREKVRIVKLLGSGSFGEVHLAEFTNRTSPVKQVAVKSLKVGTDRDTREKFALEARILAVLDHAHIVKLVGVCMDSTPEWMLIELMPLGDLLEYLRQRNPARTSTAALSTSDLVSVVGQVCEAMRYLESRSVIHRDLAARCV